MILCQVSLNAQHISDFTSIPDQNENGTLKVPSTHNFQYLVYQGEYGTLDKFDFTAYVPIANSSSNGYLSLNHEIVNGGVTVFDIQQNTSSKVWSLSNNKAVRYGDVNRPCSGAITSWGSVLSAEESTLGRILEVDPATGSSIWRHQLGRLAHENVVENLDNNRTFYTGEDTGSGVLLKFVADNPGDLSSGTLYTLDLNNAETAGTWIQIPNNSNTDTHQVALNAGATTFPGIEDVEISPIDGKVVFAVKGSGSIYRFIENDPLAGGTVSSFEKYVENTTYNTGNGNANFGTGVDNLAFDNLGNLWAFQDGGDHQMWVIDANHTPANPMVKLFGQTPVGAEPTGITFSPDHNYMFMSVQHPSSNPGSTQNDVFGNTITSNTMGLDYAVVIARNETWAASNANSVLDDFSSACAIEIIPNGIEVSGTSYDPNLDRIYTISNGNNETDRYLNVLNRNGSSSPTNAGTIDLEGFLDPEGMTHISGNQFAISDENANAIYVFEITAATTTIVKSNTTEITINNLSLATNQSLEGITYSAIDDRMYFIEEGNDINNAANNPQLYYIPNFSTVSGSVSATSISFNITDFAICGSNFDFAGISILPDGTLLVVNQVCRELFSITLNGNSVGDVDNLSLGHAQPEGVIVVSENEFWVVGEDDEIQLFVKPNVTSCDDGVACTTGETYDSNCGCTGGVIQDSDNDGVCDAEDCAPNDGSVYEGAICNDNDPCTTNDVLDDLCNCVGTPSPDSDNDGVCDAEDCAPNDGSVYEGAVCDDGDPNTTGDIYNATCVCVGIPSSTCGFLNSDYESFESGLGIWNQVSGDDLDWIVNSGSTLSSNTGPSSASDGSNYIYLEASGAGNPGKTGILVSDCFEIPTSGGAQITFDYHMYGISSQMNLTLEVSIDDGASWISLWTNQGNQGNQWNEQVVGLSLYVNMPIILRFVGVTGETWSGDISLDAIDIQVNGCDEVGDACNDNDPCTTNDVLDDLCNCVGTPSSDSDNDGVCDAEDCAPNDGSVYEGAICDDNDPCTTNDVIDNLCNCVGTPSPDSDNDGVCDAEDCAPNDGSVYEGAICDDNDPCTTNDVLDNLCNCVGTPSPDSDNDGVCDILDCEPNNVTIYPGGPCDDGSVCTTGETYDSNCGCTGGVIQDSDNDGVCDAEDCSPNDGSVYEGAICDDGDPNTTSDIYNATCVCVGIPSSTCGFLNADYESFESGLGIWNQVSGDDLDWTVNSGNTSSSNTGPSSASDGSNYIYLEASGAGNPGRTGILISDCFEIPTTGGAQITFDYHMYGASSQMNLTLEVSIDDGASWISLWTNQGNQGNQWNEQVVGLSLYVNMPIILRFVGVTGETWSGDISLDAIDIQVNGCDEVGDACNDNDPCTTNDVLDDLCNCVGTPSSDSDNDGVCDAEDCAPNDGSVYEGAICDDNDPCTTNDVLDNLCNCVGTTSPDSDNDGVCDAEDCAPNDGSVYEGAICDDGDPNTTSDIYNATCVCVGIPSSTCGFLDADYESFESGLGIWNQVSGDDLNWTVNSGNTSSSNTGPSSASDGSNYIYLEASGAGNPGKTGILVSDCFEIPTTGGAQITFDYHMYGASSQMNLTLEVSIDDGASWISLWTNQGDQGNQWNEQVVGLSLYVNMPIILRFVGVTGETWSGDISLDAIDIQVNGCDEVGDACNDNDPCTTNDVLDDLCNCVGTPSLDSDNDGVCDILDCEPNNVTIYPGGPCDDGSVCTTGETYDSNCGCTGGVIQDSDNDGVCDAEDCSPNDGSVYEGAICDDGDPNTTSDIYNATCVCVGIPSSTCGFLNADYESFESGLGIWNQVSGDDLDWTVNSGNTSSSNTGPSSASDGSNYIYLEASGAGNPGRTGILISDCFEIPTTGGAQITFDYHMYGASSQMNLTLEVSIDDGASWISLWTNQGNQGNQWNEQVVGLSLYVNMPIILRFVGVTGETWSGDISLDAIDIQVNGCDEVGDACNDNDPCTTNDVLDDLCNCVGTPSPDSDNDGVCDIVDCEPNNATVYPGGPCDDGNVCTVGDTLYEADGVCDCIGNIIDSDNDGVCDAEDCAPNDGSVYQGAPCDDGNPNTPIDAIDINCNCTGIDYISDFGVLCYSINSSYNDSEEILFNGSTYEESTDIELIFDGNRGNQVVGLRFENINIPDGATIVDASIQFTSDELNSVATNLVIEGEAADNSAPITEGVNVISSRVRTSTAVAWAPPAWISVGANGTDQKTPDLGGIVQEIIDRPGYIDGGAMTFIISGTGERTAVSFDKNPNQAPKLCIVYHLAQGFDCNDFFYSNNFEAGLGAWSDGGIDCRRSINDSQYADSGNYCVRLRDNTNTSVLTSDIINGSNVDLINVSFSYITNSMEFGEDFWLQISTDGGATYTIAEDFVRGVDFVNNVREFETVSLYGPFSNNVRLRFRCDASSNGDYVYIDDIVVDLCNGFYLIQDPENLETELRSEITVDELTMKVYPNPVTMGEELIIEMPSDIEFEDLSIFSIDGKRAAQVKYNGTGKYRIPTSYISQGTYMIRLQTKSEVIHKKIMVIN